MENREYFQMMQLAEILESNSKCDLCQTLIQNHTIIELYTCLQELSKSHSKFVKAELRHHILTENKESKL